jgi:hypothetical protein
MDLDFETKGMVKISMVPYLQEIVDEFPEDLGKPASTPAGNHLFEESDHPIPLNHEQAQIFHHTIAKLLWAALRARPDLLTALSFLMSRVKNPNEDDLKKLVWVLRYLKHTIDLPLILSADDSHIVKLWVDASFGTRADLCSQTGGVMSMGHGSVQSVSQKQKLNTKSSIEAETVAPDDVMSQVIWTRYFLIAQGFEVSHNILYQDNRSAMLLEQNGIGSSSRRTWHINVHFFFIKDRISTNELEV